VALGTSLLDPTRTGLHLTDQNGGRCTARIDRFHVEASGPLRVCVLATGVFLDPEDRLVVEFDLEYHFFPGLATVRLHYTLRNPRAAPMVANSWKAARVWRHLVIGPDSSMESSGFQEVDL